MLSTLSFAIAEYTSYFCGLHEEEKSFVYFRSASNRRIDNSFHDETVFRHNTQLVGIARLLVKNMQANVGES